MPAGPMRLPRLAVIVSAMTRISLSCLRRHGLIAVGLAAVIAPAAIAQSAIAAGSVPTCAGLTKAQLQPLLVYKITKIVDKTVSGEMYFAGNKKVGETCVVNDTDTSNALAITVLGGSVATKQFTDDSVSEKPTISVPGIGDKAFREKADSKGSVGTPIVSAIKGSTYCSVTPNDGQAPGEARLEKAAGDSSDIGDSAYADIDAADGTLCNRIFHSGNTSPASALAALKKVKPRKGSGSTGGGLDVQP
jgi:hypothetical protein